MPYMVKKLFKFKNLILLKTYKCLVFGQIEKT